MRIAPLDQVVISENRQRREFVESELVELSQSIQLKRLLHAPVFRLIDGGKLELVAGERRYRAISLLAQLSIPFRYDDQIIPPGSIPYTLIDEHDPVTMKELELEENVLRKDLSWQDYSAAIAELDELRATQALAEGKPHTIRDTASEIAGRRAQGSEITKVSDALLVAKHLSVPEVAAAKTQREAIKIIKKNAEAAHRSVLAAQFDLTKTPHTLACADVRTFSSTLPDGKFQVMLTDPPYGIEADNFGSMADTRHDYEDSYEYAMSLYKHIASEGFRVCAEQAHAYVFLDPRNYQQISLYFQLAGWEVWPTMLVWNKLSGMLPRPEHGPRRTYEGILYAIKGGKTVRKVGADVLTIPMVSDRVHGAQKPVALYTELLSRSTVPGDNVVDFFVGSGTIFPASNQMKVVATGCERVRASYEAAITRINAKEDAIDLSILGA